MKRTPLVLLMLAMLTLCGVSLFAATENLALTSDSLTSGGVVAVRLNGTATSFTVCAAQYQVSTGLTTLYALNPLSTQSLRITFSGNGPGTYLFNRGAANRQNCIEYARRHSVWFAGVGLGISKVEIQNYGPEGGQITGRFESLMLLVDPETVPYPIEVASNSKIASGLSASGKEGFGINLSSLPRVIGAAKFKNGRFSITRLPDLP